MLPLKIVVVMVTVAEVMDVMVMKCGSDMGG